MKAKSYLRNSKLSTSEQKLAINLEVKKDEISLIPKSRPNLFEDIFSMERVLVDCFLSGLMLLLRLQGQASLGFVHH